MTSRGRGSAPDRRFARQGNTWAIVAILAIGAVAFALLGGLNGGPGCGESPPYLSEDARICFLQGYRGPMNSENLLPFLDMTLEEARAAATEEGWTVYVKRRDDGLEPDAVGADERLDRLGVELDDGRIRRVWPG